MGIVSDEGKEYNRVSSAFRRVRSGVVPTFQLSPKDRAMFSYCEENCRVFTSSLVMDRDLKIHIFGGVRYI